MMISKAKKVLTLYRSKHGGVFNKYDEQKEDRRCVNSNSERTFCNLGEQTRKEIGEGVGISAVVSYPADVWVLWKSRAVLRRL